MHSSSCVLDFLDDGDRLTKQLRDSSRAANHLLMCSVRSLLANDRKQLMEHTNPDIIERACRICS